MTTIPTENGFAAFNLPRALMTSLEHMKYTNPTPVQAQAIPAAMKGKDVLGSAQTGTGKTGAFIIPVLARLMTDMHAAALVMTPTRELAAQILTVARQMMHKNETIKTALLIGGESMGRQRAQLSAKPRLVIGTPGRINDHLRDRTTLFQSTNILVLDEADRMLDMGFTPQINAVIKHLPAQRQTLMFSATFPKEIIAFTQTYMKDPVRVTIEPERTSAASIVHETLNTTEKTRYEDLLNELHARQGSIILFIKTKHGADRIAGKLDGDGHSVGVIHGGLTQSRRDKAVAAFRSKKIRIMVATDVAARGLDVPHIEHVINYDLPQVAEDYVHRIGRTGRNGQEGRALSFLMPSERGKWSAIQRILNPSAKPERGERPQRGSNRNMGHSDREYEQEQVFGGGQGQRRENARGGYQGRGGRGQPFKGHSSKGNNRPFAKRDGFDPMAHDSVVMHEPAQDTRGQERGEERGYKNRDGQNNGFKRGGFKKPFAKTEGGAREDGQRRDFRQREGGQREGGQREGGQFDGKPRGGFKKPYANDGFRKNNRSDDNRGNAKPRGRDRDERNFNVEGAGGEDRFRDDKPAFGGDQGRNQGQGRRNSGKPFGDKPFGNKSFGGKKAFFGKGKPGKRRAAS